MLISELLNEIRRNPELNPKMYYVEKLKEIARTHKNAFVTYTYVNKIGIYPKSVYSTPIGIYAYPIQYVLDVEGNVPFPDDPNYAKIFVPIGNIVYLSKVNSQLAELYINKAAAFIKTYHVHDEELTQLDIQYAPQKINPPNYLWYKIYALSRILARHSRKPIRITNRVVWSHLGVDGVVDDTNSGIIHGSEPTQAVFFHVNKLNEIESFQLKFEKPYKSLNAAEIEFYLREAIKSNQRNFALEKYILYKARHENLQFASLVPLLKHYARIFNFTLPILKLITTSADAYKYARFHNHTKRSPELESVILKDPKTASKYAINILNHNKHFGDKMVRWPEAEPIIMKDPESATNYASQILKKRWPEAEEYIKKDPEYAFHYANDLIKERWPEAEEYIKKDPQYAYQYALDVINKKNYLTGKQERWPEAEEYIKKDPRYAYRYAINILKRRWPEAEEYIKQIPDNWDWYKIKFNIE